MKICHRLRDLDLLRANSFAALAADTGRRVFFFWFCHKRHRRDKSAAGKAVLVVQLKQHWDIESFWTVCGAVAAGGTWKDVLYHVVCDAKQCGKFLFVQSLVCFKRLYIICKLLHAGHARKDHCHPFDSLQEAE